MFSAFLKAQRNLGNILPPILRTEGLEELPIFGSARQAIARQG
jgi:hypothetical protein